MGEKGKDGNSMRCCLSNRHKMTTSSSLSITRAKMNTNTKYKCKCRCRCNIIQQHTNTIKREMQNKMEYLKKKKKKRFCLSSIYMNVEDSTRLLFSFSLKNNRQFIFAFPLYWMVCSFFSIYVSFLSCFR